MSGYRLCSVVVVGLFIYLCTLSLAEKHVSHLEGLSAAEINRLLGTVVDVENIFMSMHREDDHDTKRVYYYLFKVCVIYLCNMCNIYLKVVLSKIV